jgi:hypothetical protein
MIFVCVQGATVEKFYDYLEPAFWDDKQMVQRLETAFRRASGLGTVHSNDVRSQMMGTVLFMYLCVHVGEKPYLKMLKQNAVDAVSDWVSEEIVKEVYAQVVLLKVGGV